MTKRATPPVVVVDAPKSYSAEAYRILRANLQYANPDAPLRRVLVTSAVPEEGKSTTVANLGACIAQADRPVLLVDADLRKPVLHTLFRQARIPGLSSYLAGNALLDAIQLKTAVPNLSLVPSGPVPPNPAELLASRRMREFLEAAQERYDLVILDSPPVLAVSDVCAVAPLVDGVLLVVRSGGAPRAVLRRAKEQLDAVHARVVAAVLNRFDPAADGYSRRYYRRYDTYYHSGSRSRESSGTG